MGFQNLDDYIGEVQNLVCLSLMTNLKLVDLAVLLSLVVVDLVVNLSLVVVDLVDSSSLVVVVAGWERLIDFLGGK